MSIIVLKNIKKIIKNNNDEVTILKNISLEISSGEMVAIVGTSGAGKTTLLNIISGLDKPNNGDYFFKDKLISSYNDHQMANFRNEEVGLIVQDFALIDKYNIINNIRLPLDYSKKKYSKKEKMKKIENLLQELNLLEKKNNYIYELSGGQKQRVAIARALINNPSVILADEPTGSLDSKTSHIIMNIFKKLNKDGKTIIIVTHDLEMAKNCDRIITISDGEIKDDYLVNKLSKKGNPSNI